MLAGSEDHLGGKRRLVGEKVTAGGVPTPVSGTVCGLPGALSAMLTAAFLVPVAVGVNVTLIWQLPFGGTELGQLLVWAKSLLLVPVIPIEVIVSTPAPVLVRVVTCGLLVVPTP